MPAVIPATCASAQLLWALQLTARTRCLLRRAALRLLELLCSKGESQRCVRTEAYPTHLAMTRLLRGCRDWILFLQRHRLRDATCTTELPRIGLKLGPVVPPCAAPLPSYPAHPAPFLETLPQQVAFTQILSSGSASGRTDKPVSVAQEETEAQEG